MKIKMSTSISLKTDPKRQRSCFHCFFPTVLLLSAPFFTGSAFLVTGYKEMILGWRFVDAVQNTTSNMCETQCRPHGSETLPKGIVLRTSDLELRPLCGSHGKKKSKSSMNLLAMAVGIKQKESVNKIVKKFRQTILL